MGTRKKIFDAKGNHVTTIMADEAFAELHYPGRWADEEDPPPVPTFVITKYALMKRFTDAEWEELDLLSQHDKAASKPNQRKSVAIRRGLQMVNAVGKIDLSLPETRARIAAMLGILQQEGVIPDAAARTTAICDTPATDEELP